ncbi:chaperone protein dnaJ 11, chloroplastic-like [Impatiens glandulifera]|uniref:chaperone protein dnaJ 11, chloroplastic-like n=1 Tax=Impatiens glandulifera TaxID=253017 RepID=UPI001FB10AB3|nr:chaperone protein dnaJ 11, chloroplastic-like [Impatiens glandulifera]
MATSTLSSSPFLLSSSSSSSITPISGNRISLSPATSVKFRPLKVTASTCFCPPKVTSHRNSSFYEVLGIHVGASGMEIKAAYRKLARICHPDVDRSESSAGEFIKIHNAYSTLSDPDKRADYDRKLVPRSRSNYRSYSSSPVMATAAGSKYSGYVSRNNWETDQCW